MVADLSPVSLMAVGRASCAAEVRVDGSSVHELIRITFQSNAALRCGVGVAKVHHHSCASLVLPATSLVRKGRRLTGCSTPERTTTVTVPSGGHLCAELATNSCSSTAARLMRHRTAWLLAVAWLVTTLVAVGSATDRTPPVLAAPHHVRGTQGCMFSSMQRRQFCRRSLKGPAAPATACLTSGVHALCAGFSTHVTNHARQGCTAK